MSQEKRTNCIGSALKRRASAFLILIIFILSLFINQSEAGWIHTEGEDMAVEFIHTLQTGNLEKIKPYLDPDLLVDDKREALTNAIAIFPKGNIKKITRTQVNVNYKFGSGGKRETLQFYIEMDNMALFMEEVLQKKGDQFVIQGFHFNDVPMNMMSQFPFSVIPWVQPKNVFLAVGVFNVIFITVVLLFLFIKPLKHKWLWLPVIFAGFAEASAQWVDDGPWSFTLLAVKYPSIWFTEAAGQDPWSIIVSYPLGATIVLFLLLIAKPEPETATMSARPQNGMPRRTQVQPRQRSQPTGVGK